MSLIKASYLVTLTTARSASSTRRKGEAARSHTRREW